jgi:hypothetical protein
MFVCLAVFSPAPLIPGLAIVLIPVKTEYPVVVLVFVDRDSQSLPKRKPAEKPLDAMSSVPSQRLRARGKQSG